MKNRLEPITTAELDALLPAILDRAFKGESQSGKVESGIAFEVGAQFFRVYQTH